jgi:hypothetical protein
VIYTEDFSGETPWMEAMYYMSLLLDRSLSKTVLVSANMDHACMAEDAVLQVYRVLRPGSEFASAPTSDLTSSRVVEVDHIYDLPELLGLVACSADNEWQKH